MPCIHCHKFIRQNIALRERIKQLNAYIIEITGGAFIPDDEKDNIYEDEAPLIQLEEKDE